LGKQKRLDKRQVSHTPQPPPNRAAAERRGAIY
jgi:hypothetical protein